MDRPNIFKSSKFHLDSGDILHITYKDHSGDIIYVELCNNLGVVEDSCTIPESGTTEAPTTTAATTTLGATTIAPTTTLGTTTLGTTTLATTTTGTTTLATTTTAEPLAYMTLTTPYVGTFDLTLGGTGAIEIYWGDGNVTFYTLTGDEVVFSHLFTGGSHVISIYGAEYLDYISAVNYSISAVYMPPEMVAIEYIYLSNNNLTSFTARSEWVNVIRLDLADNNLNSLSVPATWTSMSALYINDNNLNTFTTQSAWAALFAFDISGNNLTTLTAYAAWSNLQTLFAYNNALTTFTAYSTWGSSLVLFLDLSGNAITDSAVINAILVAVNSSSDYDGWIDVSGGTNAVPTGAGLTAITSLESKGIDVISNAAVTTTLMPTTTYYYGGGGTTWYVDWTTGDDSAGDGTIGNPWKTLYKATSTVPAIEGAAGDVIYLNSGTHYAVQQSLLDDEISIEGAGLGVTRIESSYNTANEPLIKLRTTNGWLYDVGHQHISGITFDGNLTTNSPIGVEFRSYVSIHDCYFVDFLEKGCYFYGCSSRTTPNPYISNTTKSYYLMPDAYAMHNEFRNNTVINCSRWTGAAYSGNGAGNLQVGAQDGMVIRNNVIYALGRGALLNGYGIKFHDEGYNKNSTINGNTITVGRLGVDVCYEFAIEWWVSMGGDRIYDNRIIGAIDLVHAVDYDSVGYSVNIYDNDIGYDATPATQERGVMIEGVVEYANIYDNYIHHVGRAIYIPRQGTIGDPGGYSGNDRLRHVRIYNNEMVQLGQNGSTWQTWGFHWNGDAYQDETQYLYITNNVIEAVAGLSDTTYGIMLPTVKEASHIYIDNNILLNWDHGAIYATGSRTTATDIYIRNNNIYNSYNSNDPVYVGGYPTAGITTSGTTKVDPVFESGTYELSASSPVIASGLTSGLQSITDKRGYLWLDPPAKGAHEYGSVLATTTLAPATTLAPSTLTTSLRAAWLLNEVTGNALDAYSTYDGTLVNAPTRGGTFYTFERDSSQRVTCGTGVGDMSTDDFSISFRFTPTSLSNSPGAGLCGNWGDSPYFYTMVNSTNYIVARVNFGGGNLTLTSDGTALIGTWYHVVLTFDRSGVLRMYVNGTLQSATLDISAGVAVDLSNPNMFSIGMIGDDTAGYYGDCSMNQVYLWRGRLLSQADVTSLYGVGSGNTYPFV